MSDLQSQKGSVSDKAGHSHSIFQPASGNKNPKLVLQSSPNIDALQSQQEEKELGEGKSPEKQIVQRVADTLQCLGRSTPRCTSLQQSQC